LGSRLFIFRRFGGKIVKTALAGFKDVKLFFLLGVSVWYLLYFSNRRKRTRSAISIANLFFLR
jgi:hypothetical protein